MKNLDDCSIENGLKLNYLVALMNFMRTPYL